MVDHAHSADFSLQEVLPYAIVRAAHVLEQAFTAAMATEGLTVRHFGILAQFTQTSSTTAAAIARALDVTPQSISPHIEALKARGLLNRSPGSGRGRPIELTLTEDGQHLLRRALIVADAEREHLTSHMTAAEQQTMKCQLREMTIRAQSAPTDHAG